MHHSYILQYINMQSQNNAILSEINYKRKLWRTRNTVREGVRHSVAYEDSYEAFIFCNLTLYSKCNRENDL